LKNHRKVAADEAETIGCFVHLCTVM